MHKLLHGIGVIGLEAGPLSQWLHKALTGAGFETALMESFGSHRAISARTASCRRDLCHSCMTAARLAPLLPGRTVSMMTR